MAKPLFKMSMDFRLIVEPIHLGPYGKDLQSIFPINSLYDDMRSNGVTVLNETSLDFQILTEPNYPGVFCCIIIDINS